MFLSATVSVEETQKGWVRDPISSGGRTNRAFLWTAMWKDQRASPEGAAGLRRRGHTALRPAACCCRCHRHCCRCCCWVHLHCLLWEDFKPCAAIKISVLTLWIYSPLVFHHWLGRQSHQSSGTNQAQVLCSTFWEGTKQSTFQHRFFVRLQT